MANVRTHYDNLKVTRDAPVTVIKAAYKALCQTFHPDKFQGNSEEAERVIKLVNRSYAVLIDPVKREAHNAWIRQQEAEAKHHSKKPPFNATDKTAQPQPDQKPHTQQPPPSSANSEAMFQQAYELNDRGRYEEAFSLYRQLADQGHAKAQFNLGVMYDRGHYVTQDYVQAVSWYVKAAEQGNANAQYNLALKYQMGQGVTQDESKAAYWYRRAAEEGSAKK
ncbi:MAG: J domain-containing protein [Methylobacter sp.]|nr:J domain-containing protein [Methylobacter sp.]